MLACVYFFLSLGYRFKVASSKMRRSGAPSQLSGNAVKKPRFVAPAASTSCLIAGFKPLSPKPRLGNALEKVNYSQHLRFSKLTWLFSGCLACHLFSGVCKCVWTNRRQMTLFSLFW